MSVLHLHIVGMPYRKDIEGHVTEFLEEAPRRSMTVRVQRDNEVDSHAIRAYDWEGRHVGYVSRADLPVAWGALRACGRQSLRGMVVSTNVEHPCAVFECSVPCSYEPAYNLYSQQPFLEWHYSGPMLDYPDVLDKLEYMCDEIPDRLAESAEWCDSDLLAFRSLVARYACNSLYDISAEGSACRQRIVCSLKQADIDELSGEVAELEMAVGRTGREAAYGSVLRFWMQMIQSQETTRRLLVVRHDYDVNEIECQLKSFPHMLYYEWLANRERFVPKVLYACIPREVLWRFVSGIAFVELEKQLSASASDDNLVRSEEHRQGEITVNINTGYQGGDTYVKGDNIANGDAVQQKVVQVEDVATKQDRRAEVNSEQMARAIESVNGKGKAVDQYQKWLGVCCLLMGKYGYPKELQACCSRISKLPFREGALTFACKYDNVRRFPGLYKFVYDYDNWDTYKPKSDEERKIFGECQSVARDLENAIQDALKT